MAGNSVIGALRVVLGLDSANFEAGLKRGQVKAFDFSRGVKSALGDVNRGLVDTGARAGAMGSALSAMGAAGLVAAAGLGVAVAGLQGARKALAFADEIGDTANKLAVTTDALQEYRYAVHALGGDYKDADAALEGFSKAFGAAHAKLSARAAKPFAALGLDPQDFSSTEEALQAVIAKISALKSTAEQAAIADKLGLTAMLPALRAGNDQFDRLRAQAQATGFVMDASLIARAGELNDQFENLSTIVDVQLKSALIDLAPILGRLLGTMGDMAKAASGVANALRSIPDKSTEGLLATRTQASNDAAKFGQRKLAGQRLTPNEQKVLDHLNDTVAVADAELAKRAAAAKPAPPRGTSLIPAASSGGGRDRSGQVRSASATAVEAATKAELQARQALIGDIQKLADLRLQEIQQETAAANARLKEDAAQGKITEGAAATAIALNNRAAGERKAVVTREAEEKLAAHGLAQREAIAAYAEKAAAINAELAGTAEAQNRIELKALAARQEIERVRQQQDLQHQVAREEITQAYADQVVAAQAEAQAAEVRKAERDAQARLEAETRARAEAAAANQIDLLNSQRDLAKYAYQRRDLELEILKIQQDLERAYLEQVANSPTSTPEEKDQAKKRLAIVDKLFKNQTKAVEAAYSLQRAYDDTAKGVQAMADAFKNHDWAGILKGLQDTIAAVKLAMQSGGIAGGIGAAAGAIAPMVGGVAGRTLGGIASGASLGTMILPGIGTAIGALVGGIAGLFGGNSAKKKQKQAEAQAAAEKEAARLAQLAADKRSLEIALMEAGGDAAGALAARRADELAAMDASLRGLQQQVWAMQDAATLAQAQHDLDIRLMEATGDAVGALAAKRADELKALDAALRPTQEAIYAAEDLANAMDRQKAAMQANAALVDSARAALSAAVDQEASVIEARIQQFQSLADSLQAFGKSLNAGEVATAAQNYDQMAAALSRVTARASLGDVAALSAFQGVGEAFKAAALANAATREDYLRDQGKLKAATEKVAGTALRQVDIGHQQLDALYASVSGLIEVRDAVLTVAEGIANLNKVLQGYTSATGQKLGLNPSANVALAAATGYTGDFGAGGFQAWIVQQDDATKAKAHQILEAFGQTYRLSGFKNAGSFKVGGFGAADSQLMQFMATPGEMVNVTHGDSMAAMAAEISGLRTELRGANAAIAVNTAKTARLLTRWDGDGQPAIRDVS